MEPQDKVKSEARAYAKNTPIRVQKQRVSNLAQRVAFFHSPKAAAKTVSSGAGFTLGMGAAMAMGAGAAGAAQSAGISVGVGLGVAAALGAVSMTKSAAQRVYNQHRAPEKLSAKQLQKLAKGATLRQLTSAHQMGGVLTKLADEELGYLSRRQNWTCLDVLEAYAASMRVKGLRDYVSHDPKYSKNIVRLMALINHLSAASNEAFTASSSWVNTHGILALKSIDLQAYHEWSGMREVDGAPANVQITRHGGLDWFQLVSRGQLTPRHQVAVRQMLGAAISSGDKDRLFEHYDPAIGVHKILSTSTPANTPMPDLFGEAVGQGKTFLAKFAANPSGGAAGAAADAFSPDLSPFTGPAAQGAGMATSMLIQFGESKLVAKKLSKPLPKLGPRANPELIKRYTKRLFWTDLALQKSLGSVGPLIDRINERAKIIGKTQNVEWQRSFNPLTKSGKTLQMLHEDMACAYELQRLGIAATSAILFICEFLSVEAELLKQWDSWDKYLEHHLDFITPGYLKAGQRHKRCGDFCFHSAYFT